MDVAGRWAVMETLFHRALTFPPEERTTLVEQWCGMDAALATEILALLSSNESVEDRISSAASLPELADPDAFLRRDGQLAGSLSRTLSSAAHSSDAWLDPWLNRVLGSFRLQRLLGRGGMGVVYLAQRVAHAESAKGPEHDQAEEDSPLAAVKLLGRHLRSSPAVTQFLIERNTLAQLEHPNIARLLDGGVTDEGVPYLVMEYIDGRRLDEVCDDPATRPEEILRLMIQLAGAIQYVHRNLILHRDLKPGNVMVTGRDSQSGAQAGPFYGTVKLLDFGTLKRIGPEAEADSAMTQAGMRAVTLRYASPEHIQGEVVSTAADTYALGMILYRLIAGQLPQGMDDMPVGQYLDVLKTARIAPPSTVAAQAGKPLDPRLARDLDAVVLKAIAWDPAERYPSAESFAADLRCLLENRPISARNGTFSYRALKFYQRHTRKALATAAVLLVLAAGVAAMARESRIALAEQHRAEAGVEQERHLAHLLLFDYFDQLKQIPGSTEAQRKAVTQALSYLDGLSRTSVGPAIELDNIKAYTSMGALLDSPYEENIGDEKGAILTLEKAIGLAHQLVARNPHNLESLQASAAAETELGAVYFGAGDPQHAFRYLKSAADTSRAVAGAPGVTPAMMAKAASVIDGLGDVYFHDGTSSLNDPDKAMQTLQEVEEIYHRCLGIDSTSVPCRRGLVISFYKQGLLNAKQDPPLAGELFAQGLDELHGFPPALLSAPRMSRLEKSLKETLAAAYLHTDRAREGIALFLEAQKHAQQALAADPVDARARWDLVSADSSLADGYEVLKQPELEAVSLRGYLDNSEALTKLDPGNETWQIRHADALLWSGRAAMQRGDTAAARRYNDEGLDLIVKLAQKPDAESFALDLAAEYLLRDHGMSISSRDAGQDAALALTFAQRAIQISPLPSPAQWLNLAEAQHVAGLEKQSRDSAKSALALLSAHPHSVGGAEQAARAQKLLQN
jgi:serine/threonine protein kinase